VGRGPRAGDGGDNKQLLLKIAPASIPSVTVRRVADDVQYSSNVVNIVLPGSASRLRSMATRPASSSGWPAGSSSTSKIRMT